ncbi:unnamed protein product [Schistocephalus solidus]|uniref:Uncharacterized protein n=1 Tax=Schistocephalus solidus TaxID=70667 RepID=A0A183TJZ0_SCHSO|nr:unnamed protein product [Schistocephalus solidus]
MSNQADSRGEFSLAARARSQGLGVGGVDPGRFWLSSRPFGLSSGDPVTVQTIEKDTGEDFPGNVEQRDASVVIRYLPVPLPLVEMDDGHVFEILRNLPLAPHLLEGRCELVHHLEAAMPLLHCSDGFLERGEDIEVGIGLHLTNSVDGGVGDGGGLVEEVYAVLGPGLQDWHLLG